MTETQKGIIAGILTCTLWGLAPLYWKHIADVPPLEIIAHRIFWSMLIFGLWLTFQGRAKEVVTLLRNRSSRTLIMLAGALISINWLLFIYAIQVGRTVEASLGYYLFPLVAVVLGFVILKERLRLAQFLAFVLAALAVIYLTWGLGAAPWIALVLASTFGLYGIIKRHLDAGPIASVTTETVILGPIALIWLIGVHAMGWTDFSGRSGGYFGQDLGTSLMLIGGGFLTAVPLMLFSYATRRVSMATVGLIQYINPTLQFSVAALIFAEPVTRYHGVSLTLIWIAIAIFSWSVWRYERAARKRATAAGVSVAM